MHNNNDGASTNVSDDGTTEGDSSGPPPGFEHRNETDLGVILLSPMVEDEVRRVSS